MNIKRILTPLLIILLLFSIVVMGAPTYVNLGPTSEITGDVGVPDGSGYYINDILFSTTGLIDISTLAETDSNFIVGDGTNWVVESGATARASLGIDLSLYYLKTEIDTKGEMQTIWSVILPDLTGTPFQYDYGRFTDADTFEGRDYSEVKTDLSLNYVENLKVKLNGTQAPTVNNDIDEGYAVGSRWFDVTNDKEYVCLDNTDGAAVWIETTQSGGGGAFTDLTDTPANYTGSSLKHVRVNVGETALEFVTLGGGGDMLKATYDTDDDGDVDVAAGGTEKSLWTLYAIPYLSGTTAFGEIAIGTAEYALTVNAGANGYDWTLLQTYDAGLLSLAGLTYSADSFVKATAEDTYALRTSAQMKTDLGYMTDLVDDTDPDLGGQMQAGAHSINFTEQVLTSGTAISWNLGNSNKATLTAAHNFTITITAPSGALNAQLIITQDGTGTRIMDEIVTQSDATIATTDVNTTTEIITVTIDIPTGARIRFKTSAADLPVPLVVDTIYYAIRNSATEIKVATTKALAHAGTAVDLTDQGSGTHTVQQLVKWPSGTLGVLSTAVGSEDVIGLTYKTVDKQWYAQLAKDFQ